MMMRWAGWVATGPKALASGAFGRDAAGVITTIVVGVDGSPPSEAAVRWAADLAHATGAAVVAVHAASLVERYRSGAGSEDSFEADLRQTVEQSWCGPLRERGVLHSVVVRPEPPVELLLEVAAEEGALLVVGRRGTGLRDADLLGSTSRRLVSEAPGAVVVVGQPAAPSGKDDRP
jgi:nucleotide-binding universal stress UspA family protein